MWTPGREAGLSELKGEREGKKQRHLLTESLIQTWIHQLSFKQILCELSPGGKRKDQVPALEQSTRGDKMANTFSCAHLPRLSSHKYCFLEA